MEQTQDLRNSGIGGSDAAPIMGYSPFKTPLQLAREKLGFEKGFQGNDATRWGNLLERVVARQYMFETDKKVQRLNKTLRLKDHPEIMAHIDRRIVGERAVLECKTAGLRMADLWGPAGTDKVPEMYLLQVQHYMMFDEVRNYCDIAVLIGGQDYRIYHVEPDAELQAMILEAELAFWAMIQRGELPDPVNYADAQVRWKAKDGSEVYASDDVIAWNEELKRMTVQADELEKKIEDVELKIKSYMGEASILLGPDGKKLRTWKEQKTAGFDAEGFQMDFPDLYQECLVQSFDKALAKKMPEAERYIVKTRVFR